MSEMVCLGEIVGTHGVRGELKINCFTENPKSLTQYGALSDASGREYVFAIRFVKGTVAVGACEGVTDMDVAKKLRGTKLYIARELLPQVAEDDGYYIQDMVGLAVVSPTGDAIGVIKNMHDFGAGDIVEITFKNGKSEMFSFIDASFPVVDLAARTVVFDAPDEVIVQAEK